MEASFQRTLSKISSRFRFRSGKEVKTNLVYRDGHQWIAPAIRLDADGVSYTKAYSSAVYLDMMQDMEVLEKQVQACRDSAIPLKSLWEVEHSFWTNEDVMSCKNRIILVNGKRQDTGFVPTEYEEEYAYRRNMLQRFSKDLSEENSKLITAVVAVSVLFLLFIFLARRSNRRRFFYQEEEEDKDEYWENKG